VPDITLIPNPEHPYYAAGASRFWVQQERCAGPTDVAVGEPCRLVLDDETFPVIVARVEQGRFLVEPAPEDYERMRKRSG